MLTPNEDTGDVFWDMRKKYIHLVYQGISDISQTSLENIGL